jgi:hypothetical protein
MEVRMMTEEVRRHCAEIDRCNQRGGRMLSVADLIDAGTLSRDLAAFSLAAIGGGASFLVGAVPGGAGKTTVMGALLNLVPAGVELAAADGLATIEQALGHPAPRRCFICHEIGQGPYYAYLWGKALKAYFRIAGAGHMLATNLHADTFGETREQICRDSGVPETDLQRMNLLFFLEAGSDGFRVRRRIGEVWASEGRGPHRRIFPVPTSPGSIDPGEVVEFVPPEERRKARETIDRLMESPARTIEEVRTFLLRSRAS